MRSRDRTALALAPLFLRFVLALTFIWAGLGKFMAEIEVQGEQAAILANYGVIPHPNDRRPAPRDDVPDAPPPGEASAPAHATHLAAWQPEDFPSQPGADDPAQPDTDSQPQPRPDAQPAPDRARPAPPARPLATAADFPEPVSVNGLAGLVLGLHTATHPGLDPDDSSPRRRIWPDLDPARDYDPWPVRLAWAVALTELIGGVLIAIGLLTRIAALGVAGVMLGALWLTAIGVAIQSGNAAFGFLPNHEPFDGDAWSKPLWQLSLLCAALALFFTGPGALSLDRLLLGGPPKPAPPKPQQQTK